MNFTIFIIIFATLFITGVPIAFSMLTAATIYAVISHTSLGLFALSTFGAMDSFILIAIPMFILTAEIMNESTIADRIFNFGDSIVGFIPGGLGHVNVVTSMIFAGMSGSSAADIGGIGYLSYKAMVEKGFSKPFSAAVTASSAIIGPIIPPSIPMVIYAMVASASIGKLFLGGLFPGIFMGIGMMVAVYIISIKRNYRVVSKPSFKGFLNATKKGFFPLLTPVILLTTVTFGIVTITEAAVVAVLYSCVLGVFAYRQLGIKKFLNAIRKTFLSCGVVLIFFVAASLFSHVITVEEIPIKFANFVLGISDNRIILLIIINLFFLVLGCISDAIVNIIIFVPILLPLVSKTGLDPVAFGVIIVLNAMIGTITPPIGTNVFLTSAITKVGVSEIFRESWPFLIVLLITLIFVNIFPQTIMFLPNLLIK